ncbi:MAG TPA: lipoprotein-releasing ABC transporter permease subunit [Stellaceae bacterium]|nr:lipoprotein-releasing ABC transporter permease subunit [Stellaceae bacterium]
MIFGAFERMVAFRYLRARRAEGFVSVIAIFSLLGIMLGVATLIIVMSVMNGFRIEFVNHILGIEGHLSVLSANGPLDNFDALDKKIGAVPGIVAARPQVEGQVLASTRGASTGVLVRGMRAADIEHQPLLANGINPLALMQFKDDGVILGNRLAQRLGVAPGGQVTLLSPNGNVTAFGTMPRIKTYKIVGVFDLGMYQYDNNMILMPLDAAQLFFNTGKGVSSIEIFARDPDHLDAVRAALGDIIGPSARIVDWRQTQASYINAIEIERNVMFLILTLIILVAAFNIISGMIMMVKDKGRDIAILRTMGASRGMILRIFMMSGASIGVAGTLAGFALGIVFTENIEAIRDFVQNVLHMNLFAAEIYYFTRIPAKIVGSEVTTVVIMALVLSFLATLYPAWRAARLDPVEGLRYE